MTDFTALRAPLRFAAIEHSNNPGDTTKMQAFTQARAAYTAALAAEPSLWNDASPAVLAPVRLEARYLPGSALTDPPQLAIRVIPDDFARFQFQPQLSPEEFAAGTAYWVTAGTPDADKAAAWAAILAALGDARAAWAVDVTRPDSTVADPRAGQPLGPATSLMWPTKFTFRCWRDGQLIIEKDGNPLPLDDGGNPKPGQLGLGPDFSLLGPNAPHFAGDLPWTGASKWMVDLLEAIGVGLAVSIPVTGTNLAFDAITVVGACDSAPDDGAARLARTLQGHLYTSGLDFPPYGSPTNNTDAARSQWSTRPVLRPPDDVAAAVSAAAPGQPAVILADAFGMDTDVHPATAGRRDLLATPGGGEPGDTDLAVPAHQLIADYYRIAGGPTDGWLNSDARRSHFANYVRAAGPLPLLRVGRQPYGVLPVTDLLGWVASSDGVADELVLATLSAQYFNSQASGLAPHLSADPDVDEDPVLLGLLQLCPDAAELRAFTPTFDQMSVPFPPTNPDAVDTPWPLQVMHDQIANAGAAKSAGYFTAATGLNSVAHLGGLYWALQSYAALHWQTAWANNPAILTDAAQWTTLNADIETALQPVRALEQDAYDRRAAVDLQLAAAVTGATYRFDAWATSIATARLDAQRVSAPTGVHLGMYGWLVDVTPMALDVRGGDAGWALTPSVQHAVTTSVLFAGAQAHSSTAFDIDLSSARVRAARTTLAELRNGSTLEEVLGYQLERALHDNHADQAIETLRNIHPLPLPLAPTADIGSETARTAHLVVNGDAVRNDTNALGTIMGALTDSTITSAQIQAILDGLKDTVDAVGDVLNAEAVHRLVGGSPLRAGLAADTLGKAGAPPETLDGITTPTGGVTVTHCLALMVALPATSLWPAGKRATLDPAAEAIAAWALGSPEDWRIVIDNATATTNPTDLGLSAIDLAVELTSPAETSALAARVRPAGLTSLTVIRADGHGGPDAAPQLAVAIRELLRSCRAQPDLAAGLDPSSDRPADGHGHIDQMAANVQSWWTQVRAELRAWEPGPAPFPDPADALSALAGLGLSGARFDLPLSSGASLAARWPDAALTLPTALTDQPSLVDAIAWLSRAVPAVRSVTGDWFTGAVPVDTQSGVPPLPDTAPDTGSDTDMVDDWLRRYATIRPGAQALSDALALSGACGAAHPTQWLIRQQSAGPAAAGWVATTHPGSRSANSLAALYIDATGPVASHALLTIDRWSETVPPAPRPPATPTGPPEDPEQQAALALRIDSPDSRAPQALLLAVPPDPSRSWHAEDLHASVEATLAATMTRATSTDGWPEG